jgi:RNA polymerase sigma factor (sigma-70 family)
VTAASPPCTDGRPVVEPTRPPRRRTIGTPEPTLTALVERAGTGDEDAWRSLVARLKGVVWKTLYGFDLDDVDRKEVFGTAFFRLYERLGTVRDPERLPGWVATTTRNEVYALLRARKRLVPTDEVPLAAVVAGDHAEGLLDDELHRAVAAAFTRLRPQDQALLRLLTAEPPLAYEDIARILSMPHGSIGPTRQRCLAQLRRSPELAAYLDGGTR